MGDGDPLDWSHKTHQHANLPSHEPHGDVVNKTVPPPTARDNISFGGHPPTNDLLTHNSDFQTDEILEGVEDDGVLLHADTIILVCSLVIMVIVGKFITSVKI